MIALPVCSCPACGRTIDAATPVINDGASPRPGDLSVCIGCGLRMRFELRLVALTAEEFDALESDTQDTLNEVRGLVLRALTAGPNRGAP